MIEREQVLHVAKLARLRLSEAEVERMAGELSGILEHVDRIGELELDEVEPTSHVVELENVLRADEPRPSWPREAVLGAGARSGRWGLPGSLAAGRGLMGELLELSVAEAVTRIAGGGAFPRGVLRGLAGGCGGGRAECLSVARREPGG